MDLQELSMRSGFPLRQLRYVLDHDLVPGFSIDVQAREVGRPRTFEADAGFGIVCAAILQNQGLPHDTVRTFLNGMLAEITTLRQFLSHKSPLWAQLGDGENFRFQGEAFGSKNRPTPCRWIIPGNPAQIDPAYRPKIVIELDLLVIWKEILG